jgi:hypothetical protein
MSFEVGFNGNTNANTRNAYNFSESRRSQNGMNYRKAKSVVKKFCKNDSRFRYNLRIKKLGGQLFLASVVKAKKHTY